ncbi:hypothetical protein ABIF50_007529 [Bradyrhizobium diazoefficiens]
MTKKPVSTMPSGSSSFLPHDICQRFARRDLHHPPQDVGGMAILPQRARLVVQRQFRDALGELGEVEIAGIDVGVAIGLADQAVAIEAIGDAGGMAHQIEHRDRPRGRHQLKRLGAVVGLLLDADFHIGEGRDVFRDRIVELDLAVLDQSHRDDGRDRLAHREQAENRLVGDRRLAGHILHAEGFVIDRLAVLLDQHGCAGDLAGRDLVLEELADLGELVLIEMRAGRNLVGALCPCERHRAKRHQRAAGERTQSRL